MRPPIPEPNGDYDGLKRKAEEQLRQGLSASYRLSLLMLARRSFKEMLAGPMNVIALTVIVSLFTLSCAATVPLAIQLVAIWLLSFGVLCVYALFLVILFSLRQLKRQLTVTMISSGFVRRYVLRNPEIPWRRVIWIGRWSGDVMLCTFANATFIPREAFASPQEAQEFVQIARELHKTRGVAWREEWNGKTFGQTF